MKIQHLSVIFAIIILPVVLAVSIYVNIQTKTLSLQSDYDTKLHNATYDAIKAFQLNEINSNTQNIATEKIRDVEASVETFFNSLGMSMGLDSYGKKELDSYVPALVYTLYDGYYIYGAFENIETQKYENGLKPYVYYSARYKKDAIDITVNYTLDNYITIYGTTKDGTYHTRSGYLINPNDVTGSGNNLKYKGQPISKENLKEVNALTYDEKYPTDSEEISYIYKLVENNQRDKFYFDNGEWYRVSIDYKKIPVVREADKPLSISDNSAQLYYEQAKEFSNWVMTQFGDLKLSNAVGYDPLNSNPNAEKNVYYISNVYDNKKIFDVTNSENDPESNKSLFNEHRKNVIKYTIQTNLNKAIAGYNAISQVNDTVYNFKMPLLSETDWENVVSNVSMISFLQGIPIKSEYYNGYSIVTNNQNREFVDPNYIYFIDANNPNIDSTMHTIYDNEALEGINKIIGYRNLDFARKKATAQDLVSTGAAALSTGNNSIYYYQHRRESCYNCIITTFARNKNLNTYNQDGTEKTFSEYLDYLTDER